MPAAMTKLSTLLPTSAVFTNAVGGSDVAANARDGSWSTNWTGGFGTPTPAAPIYIAYNVSQFTAAQLTSVVSFWLNEQYNFPILYGEVGYNLMGDYTIDVNPAAGGPTLPTTGWVTLVTVTANRFSGRFNLLNLSAYKWIRIRCTAMTPAVANPYVRIQEWELWSATAGGPDDSFFIIGDSITSNAMTHTTQNFAALVKAQIPGRDTTFAKASRGGWITQSSNFGPLQPSSSPGPQLIDDMLAVFTGKYVGIAMGTNDLNQDQSGQYANGFYNSMKILCDKIIAVGKIPILPRIIYSPSGSYGPPNTNHYKAKIDQLWAFYGSQVMQGPDLYTPFFNDWAGPKLYFTSPELLHPNGTGNAKIRQLWADWAVVNVYGSPPSDTTAPVISVVASGSLSPSGAVITWATNELSDTQVEYGSTTAYGSSSVLNGSPLTSHSVTLSGLNPGTLYHYRVKSRDAAGNLATGTDNTFTTTAAGVTDITDFVLRDGRTLTRNGQAYRFYGYNLPQGNSRANDWCYGPMNVGTALEDLLATATPNTAFRMWFYQKFTVTNGLRDWAAFDKTLSLVAAAGMVVIFVFTDQYGDCDFEFGPRAGGDESNNFNGDPFNGKGKQDTWFQSGYKDIVYPRHVTSYRSFVLECVTRYRANPEILMWQLINEGEGNTDALVAFCNDMGAAIKALDPYHLLSFGSQGDNRYGLTYTDYVRVHNATGIDLLEYHDYDRQERIVPERFSNSISNMQLRIDQSVSMNKPLFVGEVGLSTSKMSQAQRALVYRAKMEAQRAVGMVGAVHWNLQPGTATRQAYDIFPGDPEMTEIAAQVAKVNPTRSLTGKSGRGRIGT